MNGGQVIVQADYRRIAMRKKLVPGAIASRGDFACWPTRKSVRLDLHGDHMLPYSLDTRRHEVILVQTPNTSTPLGVPFLYQHQYRHAEALLTMPIENFVSWTRETHRPPSPVFILGMGRSGTTLVARALHQVGGTRVFDEPDAFTSMVRWNDGAEEMVHALTVAFAKPDTRLVLKQRSFVSRLAGPIAKAFPDARLIFLYRDPVPWVRSNLQLVLGLRTMPRWLARRAVLWALSDLVPLLGDISGLELHAIATRIWIRHMEHYLTLRSDGVRMLAIHYDDLVARPEPVMSELLRFVDLPAAALPQALAEFSSDAQAGTYLDRNRSSRNILSGEQIEDIARLVNTHPVFRSEGYRLPQ